MSEAKVDVPPVPNKRRRIVIASALVVALLGAGGGAAWYVAGSAPADGKAAPKKHHNPVFATLEPFTVNLADPDGDRVAQVGVVLELVDSKASATITMLMPAVRNGILLLLSGKKSDELLTVEGKERLAREVAVVTARHLGWAPRADAGAPRDDDAAPAPAAAKPNPVQAVHFSQFLVQ